MLIAWHVISALGVATPAATRFEAIERGTVHVTTDFIPPSLVAALRADGRWLAENGQMRVSGLSNAAKRKQAFGDADRRVCEVTPALGGDRDARAAFATHLDALRTQLEASIGRGPLIAAEQYLSLHAPGARLPLHMDERHEESKGVRGWVTETRRSISWLVYLSDDGWDQPGGAGAGGGLRAYARAAPSAVGAACGANDGDLQVGWRLRDDGTEEPVFLDCWVRARGFDVPFSALYTADATSARARSPADRRARRSYISRPFETSARADEGPELYTAHMAADEARRFARVDTVPHPRQSPRLVSPAGGTLALFDSVALPHEVLPTERGERWAMAGWFHEAQQPFPEWFASES